MPYVIYSAPWLVWCTSRFLHVVPMIPYLLAYCVLILLSLAGIAVCGCSQILQRYMCDLIGGYELSIAGLDLVFLLISLVICTTI